MHLLKSNIYTVGSSEVTSKEPTIEKINFKIHKFNSRIKPTDRRNILIFPSFSEFGCETLSVVYCLPKMLKRYPGKYTIVMGWHGREFFYRHLVDEYWEISEEHMWLREYCRAFNHVSKNLKKAEKEAKKQGQVVNALHLSNFAVFPKLTKCPHDGGNVINQVCFKCGNIFQEAGFFSNIKKSKKEAVWLPKIEQSKIDKIKKYLPENAVGITARNRKTWGRNLDKYFYKDLIELLLKNGYNPVWMGEKISCLPCPSDIIDFTVTEESKDLEMTLALISQMKFTIQFWTASSRLAGLVGTPFIIMESPDQIWELQEGFRINLMSKGQFKRIICDYKKAVDDLDATLMLVEKAIQQMQSNDYSDIIGLVEDYDNIIRLKSKMGERIGDE